jgi:Ca2+-binding EF-hand superfamily protein
MQARVEDTVVRRGHFETSAHDARNLVRSRAKVFESADKDLNGVLSFEEFVHTLPKKFVSRRSGEELKRLFDITDVNGDGRVSKQEFFMSTLSLSSKMTGSGLEAVFRKYDRTKDTALDILEFRCMCDDMGFGDIADSLASELPRDENGNLQTQALMDTIMRSTSETAMGMGMSELMKSFVVALSVEANNPVSTGSGEKRIDTTRFSFTGHEPEIARSNLTAMLLKHNVSLATILRQSDQNDDNTISIQEFVHAFEMTLGFRGPKFVAYEIFDQIDADQSGSIAMDELSAWLRGELPEVAKRRNAMMSMTFKDVQQARTQKEAAAASAAPAAAAIIPTDANEPAGVAQGGGRGSHRGQRRGKGRGKGRTSGSEDKAFDTAATFTDPSWMTWDAESLREHIRWSLVERGLNASDWLQAWDSESDGMLSKAEFMNNMKNFVGDEELWYGQMKDVMLQAFEKIDRDRGGMISIGELQLWLDKVDMPGKTIIDRRPVRLRSLPTRRPAPTPSPDEPIADLQRRLHPNSHTSHTSPSSSPPKRESKRELIYRPRFYAHERPRESSPARKPQSVESRASAWLAVELQLRAARARSGRPPPGWRELDGAPLDAPRSPRQSDSVAQSLYFQHAENYLLRPDQSSPVRDAGDALSYRRQQLLSPPQVTETAQHRSPDSPPSSTRAAARSIRPAPSLPSSPCTWQIGSARAAARTVVLHASGCPQAISGTGAARSFWHRRVASTARWHKDLHGNLLRRPSASGGAHLPRTYLRSAACAHLRPSEVPL